jgi:iron complex outermembrane receptor protein
LRFSLSAGALILATFAFGTNSLRAEELEEVLVTAQRRTESAQDIGVAISVVDRKQLDALRIQQPIDLANAVPGLSTYNATSGGTPLFAIRGIGLDDFNPNNTSGVGTYIDDVYASSAVFLNGQLFDVERVEVLKGPQGTLYGKNATGGAINIISRKPSDDLNGYVDVSYGRWNSVDVQAAVGGRIADMLTGRLASTYTGQGEGYQTDIDTGFHEGKPNRGAVRGQLEFKPTSNFSALLNVHLSKDTSVPPSPQSYNNERNLPPDAKGLIDTPSNDPTQVRVGNLSPQLNERGFGTSLALNYDADDFALTSTTGYDHFNYRTIDNNDGIAGPTFDFFQNDLISQYYEELRATSKHGLFSGLVDWVVGASYAKDSIHGLDSSDQSAPFVGEFLTPPDFSATGLSIARANYDQARNSFGAYLHTETHVTDRLSFIVGGRYSHDRLAFSGISTENGSEDGGIIFKGIGSVITSLDEVHNEDNVSYQAGINYKLLPHVLLYATASTAYKAGAYYASPALDPAAWGYVNPEHVFSYELGEKSTVLGGRLQINGSYFHFDYKDRQSLVDFVSPSTGVFVSSLDNIPKSAVDGFELEADAAPLEGFHVSGSVSYLDARVTEALLNVRGAPLLLAVPDGTQLSMAPRWTFQARTSYEWPISGVLKASVASDYSWRSAHSSALGDPNAVSGIQKLLGASFTVGRIGKGASVSLWGRNLTNENFTTSQFTSFYGGQTEYRELPRTYGIEVRYEF